MSITEYDWTIFQKDKQKLLQIFTEAESDYGATVIRGGGKLFTPEQWITYLRHTQRYQHDTRHFTYEATLENMEWWEISNQKEKEDSYCYSKTLQPLHTDNAWFSDAAEINFFCMLKQAESGGEQFLLPLDRLIEHLSKVEPQLLHDLQSTPVKIAKGNQDSPHVTTIIKGGKRPTIYWNYYRTNKDVQEVVQLCESFFQFLKKILESKLVEKIKARDHDCFMFRDNYVLHGRNSFHTSMERGRVLYQSMWKILS